VSLLIIIVFGFLMMWLFVLLPQRRRQAAQSAMLDALEPGDEVLTAGGLYGSVVEIDDEEIALEVAPQVQVRVARRAIAAVIPPEEDDDELEESGVEEPAGDAEERGGR